MAFRSASFFLLEDLMPKQSTHGDYTYRDPTLSMWQSAVAQVQRNRSSVQARTSATLTAVFAARPLDVDSLMSPARAIGQSLVTRQPVTFASTPRAAAVPAAAAPAGVLLDCAKVAGQFLWAEITGDKQKS